MQGFPDEWTLVPNEKGKPMSDSQRYRQMGNAVSVPVAEWLGRSIVEVLHGAPPTSGAGGLE